MVLVFSQWGDFGFFGFLFKVFVAGILVCTGDFLLAFLCLVKTARGRSIGLLGWREWLDKKRDNHKLDSKSEGDGAANHNEENKESPLKRASLSKGRAHAVVVSSAEKWQTAAKFC